MSSMNLEKLYIGGQWVEPSTSGRIANDSIYGEFKQSGIGREGGPEDFQAYTETKTILLD